MRLEDLVHVDALGKVEARVAHQLEVVTCAPGLDHETRTFSIADADILGGALDEVDLLAAGTRRSRAGPVQDDDADVPVGGLHRDGEHALETHVRREQREADGAGLTSRTTALPASSASSTSTSARCAPVELRASTPRPKPARPCRARSSSTSSTAGGRADLLPHAVDAVLEQVLEVGGVRPARTMSALASASWARVIA